MLTIDGKAVEATGSLLDACRRVGADVPALCHDDRLRPAGHCRGCLVEVDGRYVTACSTPAQDGATVVTRSEALQAYRRDLAELMLAEVKVAAPVLAQLGGDATGERYKVRSRKEGRKDASHPYLRLDMDACILCRLCLRACDEIQGQFVYAIEGRGSEARLSWGDGAFADTDCVSCGACASVCPTGAITDTDHLRLTVTPAERTVRTTCSYCGVGCQLEVQVARDRVVAIDGVKDAAVNRGHLCVKGRYAHGFSRHPDRLSTPLVRDAAGELVEATWEEALGRVAAAFAKHRGRVAALSSSRCTNEENYLVQKWMRAGMQTHNVDCCARVCHAPTATGMIAAFGTGAATNSVAAEIDLADVVLVAGANPTEAHPVMGARIKQAALGGATLIVIDPRRTELAGLADVHLQLSPGTNVPLLNSIAAVLVEEGLVDMAFITARTEGFEYFQRFIAPFAPESQEAVTGVPAALVRKAARLYGRAARPMAIHGLGMTEHLQGSQGVMLLCNLPLLTGAIGRDGVGINPLRGQNNVQGAADMGCQPNLMTGYARPERPEVQARFAEVWGRPVPAEPGMTLPKMYDAARAGELGALYILGENVVQTDPNEGHTIAALKAVDFLVVQEIFLTETAALADVVLPGASFLEKDGTFTNGERRVQRVRKAIEPPGQARADWEVICALMEATGYPQTFQHPSEIMDEIAALSPALAGVSYGRLEGNGLQWPVPAADHPGTRTLHTDAFPRGRGHLSTVAFTPSPALAIDAASMKLITGRRLEHYNCGTMTRRTPNLTLSDQDELELHPSDAADKGIADGDVVVVRSAFGEAEAVARVTDRVQVGTLFMTFHFPETHANAVTTDVLDNLADCPEYKLTAVEIEKAAPR